MGQSCIAAYPNVFVHCPMWTTSPQILPMLICWSGGSAGFRGGLCACHLVRLGDQLIPNKNHQHFLSFFFSSFFQLDLKNTYLCFRLLLYFFLKDIGSTFVLQMGCI